MFPHVFILTGPTAVEGPFKNTRIGMVFNCFFHYCSFTILTEAGHNMNAMPSLYFTYHITITGVIPDFKHVISPIGLLMGMWMEIFFHIKSEFHLWKCFVLEVRKCNILWFIFMNLDLHLHHPVLGLIN